MGNGKAHSQGDAREQQLDAEVDVPPGDVADVSRRGAAGVVEQHVQSPEALGSIVDHPLHVGFHRDVLGLVVDVVPEAFGQGRSFGFGSARDHYGRSLGRE